MFSSVRKIVMYQSTSTSVIFGLVGATFGWYKGVEKYEDHHEYNKKIILSTLTNGGIFALIGAYPVVTFPIICSLYAYEKYTDEYK
jgi:hypothetical protein